MFAAPRAELGSYVQHCALGYLVYKPHKLVPHSTHDRDIKIFIAVPGVLSSLDELDPGHCKGMEIWGDSAPDGRARPSMRYKVIFKPIKTRHGGQPHNCSNLNRDSSAKVNGASRQSYFNDFDYDGSERAHVPARPRRFHLWIEGRREAVSFLNRPGVAASSSGEYCASVATTARRQRHTMSPLLDLRTQSPCCTTESRKELVDQSHRKNPRSFIIRVGFFFFFFFSSNVIVVWCCCASSPSRVTSRC